MYDHIHKTTTINHWACQCMPYPSNYLGSPSVAMATAAHQLLWTLLWAMCPICVRNVRLDVWHLCVAAVTESGRWTRQPFLCWPFCLPWHIHIHTYIYIYICMQHIYIYVQFQTALCIYIYIYTYIQCSISNCLVPLRMNLGHYFPGCLPYWHNTHFFRLYLRRSLNIFFCPPWFLDNFTSSQ